MLNDAVIEAVEQIVGADSVITHPSELMVYDSDGMTFHKRSPDLVVFVQTTEQVAALVRLANQHRIPYLGRGAGTGLSGGSLPLRGGMVLEFSRMNRLIEVDPLHRIAVVEPGLVNLELSKKVAHLGLHFAPDPSSQMACTIGGNISENAGGPHCLKYGVTSNHVLALEVVLCDGSIATLGDPYGAPCGYDVVGLFVGSEGTLGMVTKAWLRLTPLPEAVKTMLVPFEKLTDATDAVSEIIANGILPAALEIMDQLTIRAVEASMYAAGYPTDAAAVLLVELDGLPVEVETQATRVVEIVGRFGGREVRVARDEKERKKLWAGRKGSFGALGRISTNIYLQDTVVPRTKLSFVIGRIYEIAQRHNLIITSVFHAGDGNLHPLMVYDSKDPEEIRRVLQASDEIVRLCLDAGGTLSGEHGIGLEKRDFMCLLFTEQDLAVMKNIKLAFDQQGLCNPGKLLPSTKGCSEFKQGLPPEAFLEGILDD
ncbi:MAG: FAD-binding oxidoreductase [Acidobacteriota bacterium]